jgi:hypothetical protein
MPLPSPTILLAPGTKAISAVARQYERRRQQLVAPRIARRQRKFLQRRLHDKLVEDGFPVSARRRRLSDTDIAALHASFRIAAPGDDDLAGGEELLERLAARPSRTFLLDAPSGEGKTTFALAQALHCPGGDRRPLAPLYLDVADQSYATRLDRWMQGLDDARDAAGRSLKVAPLIMLDGVNETHSIEIVVATVGRHLPALRRHDVRLLFLFSHRHRSYAGELVRGLASIGIADPEPLALAPLAGSRVALGFYPPALQRALDGYVAAHPGWPMTRRDGAALMRWLAAHPNARVDDAPAPAELIADRYVTPAMREELTSLLDVATAAFEMLGREATLSQCAALASEIPKPARQLRTAKDTFAGTLLGHRLRVSDETVRIDSEAAIRVLGALYVAHRLLNGDPPTRLSGRTIYDVAAPFVPWALRWLAPDDPLDQVIEHHIGHEIARDDRPAGEVVPYSFYGRVVLADDAPPTALGIEVELFRSIIDAIDRDRRHTCRAAILSARRTEERTRADPVLDQLFALISGVGHRAVAPLLSLMDGETPLVESQAAYLLRAWLQRLPADLTADQRACVAQIAGAMDAGNPNLHLRYHQAQIVEQVLRHVDGDARAEVLTAAERVVAAGGEPIPPGAPRIYRALQAAVSDALTALIVSARTGRRRSWPTATATMSAIAADPALRDDDGEAEPSELLLECWETSLGLSASAFRDGGSLDLSAFVLGALTHDLWIVRWWAFSGLSDMFRFAVDKRPDEARELGAHLVDRLFATGEPMGLKQQQCALVEALLAQHDGAVMDWLGAQIAAARRRELVEGDFAAAYRDELGHTAELYLSDYVARVLRLPVRER